MKCRACGFDDDSVRAEDGFLHVRASEIKVEASFPMHEGPSVDEQVLLFACPRCGTLRIDSWRLREGEVGQ